MDVTYTKVQSTDFESFNATPMCRSSACLFPIGEKRAGQGDDPTATGERQSPGIRSREEFPARRFTFFSIVPDSSFCFDRNG